MKIYIIFKELSKTTALIFKISVRITSKSLMKGYLCKTFFPLEISISLEIALTSGFMHIISKMRLKCLFRSNQAKFSKNINDYTRTNY